MSDNDYSTSINSCINELNLDEEHKVQFKLLEQQFNDFTQTNLYNCSTINYVTAFNVVNDTIETLLQYILKMSDLLYEIPSTIDQKVFNVRVIEYIIEFVRRYNAKMWKLSSIFKTVDKFRVFNFGNLILDKDTREQLDDDRFKPFKEVHNFKEPVMKCKTTLNNPLYNEYIQRTMKRLENKDKQEEEKKN